MTRRSVALRTMADAIGAVADMGRLLGGVERECIGLDVLANNLRELAARADRGIVEGPPVPAAGSVS